MTKRKIAATATDYASLFAPITKVVDGPDGMFVDGILVAEEPDRMGEIWDYASSVAGVIKWASDAATKTRGQSVGNLRAMHQPISAGKFVLIEPDDSQKLVSCRAKVVDEAEKTKVREGVYTGFSIKAPYARKWTDPTNPRFTRWTSGPIMEGSLADIPCIPSASFSYKVVGADGEESEETRRFAHYDQTFVDLDDLANRVAAKLDRGMNEEDEEMKLSDIATKHKLDPAAFEAAVEEAVIAAKTASGVAAKCMKSAADCMDADCADHKAAKTATAAAAAAKIITDNATAAATKIDNSGIALKAADIRAIFVEELAKNDVKVDAAIAAKMAPIDEAIGSLVTSIAHLSGVVIPSAVTVRAGTQFADKTADGSADAAKAAGADQSEDAEKIAKDKGPAAGIMAIHRNAPSLVMTNRGLARA